MMQVISHVDLSILPESVKDKPKIVIKNKIDLSTGSKTGIQNIQNNPEISISAKNGDGINIVRKALADFAGLNSDTEGVFLARKRHIIAINETLSFINSAISQLEGGASELVAEDLASGRNVILVKLLESFHQTIYWVKSSLHFVLANRVQLILFERKNIGNS